MRKKSKKAEKVASDRRSKIIALSVRYLQLVAAFEAGFQADPTGNAEFATKGRLTARAGRILLKLAGSAPFPGDMTLSLDELRAKAAVLKQLCIFEEDSELSEAERAFTAVFASECVQSLEHLAKNGGAA
jgi:hypothetical protein